MTRLSFALTVACFLAAARPALAQDAPIEDATRTRARALGEEGNSLYDKGDYESALDRYERAAALVNVPTLGLKSARCLAKLGKLIEASERYLAVSRVMLAPDAKDVHKQAVVYAGDERDKLLSRLPWGVIGGDG